MMDIWLRPGYKMLFMDMYILKFQNNEVYGGWILGYEKGDNKI